MDFPSSLSCTISEIISHFCHSHFVSKGLPASMTAIFCKRHVALCSVVPCCVYVCRVGYLGWFGPALGPLLVVAAPLLGRWVLVPIPAALPPFVFLPTAKDAAPKVKDQRLRSKDHMKER